MLENPLWGDGDSRTIQFLIPQVTAPPPPPPSPSLLPLPQPLIVSNDFLQSMSHDVFEEFCDMIPKIFRVSTTRKLTKTRTHSYK